ncbi:MAG TPA: Fe-S cluster assembly protein SufD [Gammaproteobacteria bacterium]|nr:Fe-S cluster assembly protein SufD [Gammaproteobacteria bacterium]
MTPPADNPVRAWSEAFEQARAGLPGGERLAALREGAFASFASRGFPTRRDEDWKYTSLRPIEKRAFRPAPAAPLAVPAARIDAVAFADLDCHRLVFVNGAFAPQHSDTGPGPGGVHIESLANLLSRGSAHDSGSLARQADGHRFVALNAAFVRDGAFIHAGRDAKPALPIYLLFVSTPGADPVAAHPRVLVTADAGASLTVIEHFAGLDDAANFTNTVTDIAAGPDACVEHYRIQDESRQGFHIGGLHVRQDRDSRVFSHHIDLGGYLSRNDIEVALDGEGAEVTLNGLYLAGGRQHMDSHTRIDHLKPHTRSREDYRGVLKARARAVFNGKIRVHQNAQKSEAHQSNRNLLLSDEAEIDTKPELEIYADDVKCTHGATIGQLDEDALFYLRTRGIGEDMARGLLTFAFADGVIARFGLAPIRRHLERIVVGRLPDAERIREFV